MYLDKSLIKLHFIDFIQSYTVKQNYFLIVDQLTYFISTVNSIKWLFIRPTSYYCLICFVARDVSKQLVHKSRPILTAETSWMWFPHPSLSPIYYGDALQLKVSLCNHYIFKCTLKISQFYVDLFCHKCIWASHDSRWCFFQSERVNIIFIGN